MFRLAAVVFLIFHHAEIPLRYLHVIECLIRSLYDYFLIQEFAGRISTTERALRFY